MGVDGVVNCSVADLTGAVGNEGANAFTLVELMQSMALRRIRISFIILGGRLSWRVDCYAAQTQIQNIITAVMRSDP
eukprot:scaffold10235_cov131-Skeletonema_marinoi.AAC.15